MEISYDELSKLRIRQQEDEEVRRSKLIGGHELTYDAGKTRESLKKSRIARTSEVRQHTLP